VLRISNFIYWRFSLAIGEVLGLIAGLFTTGSLIPQVIHVFKNKSARDISLLFNLGFLVGGLLWLSYGILGHLTPVIIWNSLATLLVVLLLIGKLKYGTARGPQ
jgi:MtN3 and saliva related transmembrane protein